MTKLFGSWVAGGNPVDGRVDNDFYETPVECVKSLLENVSIPSIVWEPACGKYAISQVLEAAGKSVISTDLHGYGFDRPSLDFLSAQEKLADAVVTNPPFNLAEKFILKCKELDVSFAAMLLKSQYWHAAKRRGLFEEYTPSKILAMTWRPDFTGGKSPTMDCIWTVWTRGDVSATYKPIGRAA